MDIFRGLTSLVEPLSLDEAYIDVSEQVPAEKDVDEVASNLKIRVQEETGLVVTIGGGSSKTVAKIASQVAKPDGLLLVKAGTEQAFMGPLDVSIISGVGPKTAAVLRERADGVRRFLHPKRAGYSSESTTACAASRSRSS